MAITLADFTKIWASTSPLTPYSFGESNYKEGWNFIGSTPPSRQMWDSLQKQNDEKLKYIVDNFLPLDGGTMTGAIVLADGGNPLSTAGGTMDAPIGFNAQGQVGFRGTTHTNPSEVCKQLVATAGTVDSAWDDGNAKLCLHTYDDTGTNTAEDGGFALQTSDGNGNSPFLEGKPNGSLKWNGSDVITSAVTGNILHASGSGSTVGSYMNLATISQHEAGVWLLVGYIDCSTSFNNIYINMLSYTNSPSNPVRTRGDGGGGGVNVQIAQLSKDDPVNLQGYIPSGVSTTLRATLTMVRLS